MYRTFILMLFILGIIFITASISKSIGEKNSQIPKERIIYRYIPRTLEEEQSDPVYVSEIFNIMFTQPSVWLRGINDLDVRKIEKSNKYFITQ